MTRTPVSTVAVAVTCWACDEPITDAALEDRHGPAQGDPDHAEYHAGCCPDCAARPEVTS